MVASKRPTPKRAVSPKAKAKGLTRTVGRRDPEVRVQAVDQLPDSHHPSERSLRYQKAMAEVRRKVGRGKWASIATFDAPNGAAGVRRAILRGERAIDGRLSEWEVESRRTRDEGGVLIGSELYVKLKGKQ